MNQGKLDYKLPPASQLRHPDPDGQMPHMVPLTTLNRPLAEQGPDDVLVVNWNTVITTLEDALIRVKYEGDFISDTIRETIRIGAWALRRLEYEDATHQRTLQNIPETGRVAWWLSFVLGTRGAHMRTLMHTRNVAAEKSAEFARLREQIFSLRKDLAAAVDERIHRHLIQSNEQYRDLYQEMIAPVAVVRSQCREILKRMDRLHELQRERDAISGGLRDLWTNLGPLDKEIHQIQERLSVYSAYSSQHFQVTNSRSFLNSAQIHTLTVQHLIELDEQAKPIEDRLRAIRDEVMQQIYAESSDSPTE